MLWGRHASAATLLHFMHFALTGVGADAQHLTRDQSIDRDAATLLAEASAHGGWIRWHDREQPYRTHAVNTLQSIEGERAIRGIDDFLFIPKDAYFLVKEDLAHRTRTDGSSVPSPSFSSIVTFSSQLQERGIDLIFVPVPSRLETYPEKIPGSPKIQAPLGVNRKRFIHELLEADVEAIDLEPFFNDAKKVSSDPLFHPDNRHWSQHGILLASEVLSSRIARYDLEENYPQFKREFHTEEMPIKSAGHLIRKLNPKEGEDYRGQIWKVPRVLDADRKSLRYDHGSPVLILGDSYVDHFAGQSAGIAAHLAYNLRISVDAVAVPGKGPQMPQILAMKGPEFLKGRKVIIWITTSDRLLARHDEKWESVTLP